MKDRFKIARKYLSGWFWVDLVASLPFDVVLNIIDGENIFFEGEKTGTQQTTTLGLIKTMRLPRLLRLIKIMRVLRISKLAKSRPEVLWWVLYSKHANVFSLIFQFVALLLITHYMTCLFYWANTNDNGTSWFDFEECGHPVDDIIQTPPAQDVTEHVRPIIIMDAQSTPV